MSEKISLNRGRFMHNVISGEKLEETLTRVIDNAVEILKDYCGPHSGFVTLFDRTDRGKKNAKFTKDGINIMRGMQYANPLDDHVQSLLQYIGIGLEKAAGDGTTSAMIICATVVKKLRQCLYEELEGRVSHQEFSAAYDKMVEKIESELGRLVIVPQETDADFIRTVAYHQALTSSHGNEDLAQLVSTLLAGLPRRAWEHMVYRMEPIETDTKYRIEIDDASYSCKGTLSDGRMFNSDLGNTVEHEQATIVVPPYELISSSPYFDQVKAQLVEMTPDSDPLVLLLQEPDKVVWREIDRLYNEKRNIGCKIVINFFTKPIAARCTDPNCIYAICGIDAVNTEPELLVLPKIRYRFEHDTIKLFDLVTYTEEGYHPDSEVPSSPVNRLLYIIDANITHISSDPNQMQAQYITNRLKELRNTIEFASIGNVVIGGQIYEQQAAKDVLEDVLAASREAILSGVLLGGYRSLGQAIKNLMAEDGFNDSKGYEQPIAQALYEAILVVNQSVLRGCVDEDIEKFDTSVDVVSGMQFEFCDTALRQTDWPVIVQSMTSYMELLKRFGDIVPKLVCMTRMILPDAIDDVEEEKESGDIRIPTNLLTLDSVIALLESLRKKKAGRLD